MCSNDALVRTLVLLGALTACTTYAVKHPDIVDLSDTGDTDLVDLNTKKTMTEEQVIDRVEPCSSPTTNKSC